MKDKNFEGKTISWRKNDNKIHSCVPLHMKRMLYIIINTKDSLMVKLELIIFTNLTNEGGEQVLDKNMSY